MGNKAAGVGGDLLRVFDRADSPPEIDQTWHGLCFRRALFHKAVFQFVDGRSQFRFERLIERLLFADGGEDGGA